MGFLPSTVLPLHQPPPTAGFPGLGAEIDVHIPMAVPLHRAPGKCFLSKETSDRGSMKNSWKKNLPEPTVTPKNYFPFTCFREGKHSKVGYIHDRWEVLGKLAKKPRASGAQHLVGWVL